MLLAVSPALRASEPIDFNRQIRPLLSNHCFTCHGPDEAERQVGLRLDHREDALEELESGGYAIVPGDVEASELLARISSDDEYLRMPPVDSGKQLSESDVELLTEWVRQGAPYAPHWAYVRPVRPELPDLEAALDAALERGTIADAAERQRLAQWPGGAIDQFLLVRMLREGLTPSPQADRSTLIRRLSLDLTGLPPTLEEVDQFLADTSPDAYETLVDRLLQKEAYGEHWGRMWLDLARYADSAGYADDPPRTIWAYRDWVIRAFNDNLPFDQFTIEQIAGDLLPEPSEDQLIATAFHRNTLTNNEGGTSDEEFRNVAVVDRVNTTMAVWMGTTMACAQCHTHKFDPITQEEYFQMFAIFNQTEDADRRDETPVLELYTPAQREQKAAWEAEREELREQLRTPTPALMEAQRRWEETLTAPVRWTALRPAEFRSQQGAAMTLQEDDSVRVADRHPTDLYEVTLPLAPASAEAKAAAVTAIRLETFPAESERQGTSQEPASEQPRLEVAAEDEQGFVLTRVTASLAPVDHRPPAGRYVRIELPGSERILSLAEVEVFSGDDNLARHGKATQSSTAYGGSAERAIDGNTDGRYEAGTTTHTDTEEDPWWELDLGATQPVDRLVVWNRIDNGLHTRLANFRIQLLDEDRQPVWKQRVTQAPHPGGTFALSAARPVRLVAASANFAAAGFEATNVLEEAAREKGWGVGGQADRPHELVLIPERPIQSREGERLAIRLEHQSSDASETLGHFRFSTTAEPHIAALARTPSAIREILGRPEAERSEAQRQQLNEYFLAEIAEELQPQRERLPVVEGYLEDLQPYTTVPVMRELPEDRRRTTHLQYRGNFMALGQEVTPGLPAALHPPAGDGPIDRLTLAHWLVDEANPLTARVVANRYWEALFGQGIVVTSEEFGSQGEPPRHAELLDWLATELMDMGWDTKELVKRIVTSAAYRQSSAVTPEHLDRDADNTFLARGPRVRLAAEAIRDQALAVGGLLSEKRYGPPVQPPQPAVGLTAAFGSGIDWTTSEGEDRYRRGLYVRWRRSNPYPSMVAFDAPNREVCVVRRDHSNSPLQALVTLNDPVYVEAAQGLARRIASVEEATAADRVGYGFRLSVAREPSDEEREALVALYETSRQRFAETPEQAESMATVPLGPVDEGGDVVDLAAWTVVANVLLNLDEVLMKR